MVDGPHGPALQRIVDSIHADLKPRFGEGRVADYIPQLARVDPTRFGLAVITLDGGVHLAGDADLPFSIQSISKVFTLTLALGRFGESVWRRVGREPSGSAFNSIVQLEHEQGKPRNPFINAGAIVVTDIDSASADHSSAECPTSVPATRRTSSMSPADSSRSRIAARRASSSSVGKTGTELSTSQGFADVPGVWLTLLPSGLSSN